MRQTLKSASGAAAFDKFRLRAFVNRLIQLDEVVVHKDPIPMGELSVAIAATPKAVLFENAGPEHYEIIAAVCGNRRRLAAAFGVDERQVAHEYMRRLANPQSVTEISSRNAPVHQVVRTGEDVDLTNLPFYFQHEYDGGVYISAGIDFAVDPATGKRNVGCRRLMLRGRRELRSNLTNTSDLKTMYLAAVGRGERLPVSFVIGAHPLDYLAAMHRQPVDEFDLIATLRGEPLAMVRGVSNGIPVPADAELVIEGYFDELGYREMEGPYGEFYGLYGPMHRDPVFHATAITMRSDALHQTVLHSGRFISRNDAANLSSLIAEGAAWRILRAARTEPLAINFVLASNGMQHVRVSLRRGALGQARLAIAALFSLVSVKHVFVVDEDVDVFSDEEMEWAMSTRFRADRDLVIATDMPGFYADPMAGENHLITKAGFDLTAPPSQPDTIEFRRANAVAPGRVPPRFNSVVSALESGPLHFGQLLRMMGSTDGREIALELDILREQGALTRLPDGEWALKTAGRDL